MRHDNKGLSTLQDLNVTLEKPSTDFPLFCNSFYFSLTLTHTQMTSHESSEGGNTHSHTDGLEVLAENLDALKCWWLGVFIAPTTKAAVGEGCCRRAHRTVRCATGHCLVRQPRHPTVRVRPLELLTCGPPDSPVVHRTGPVHYPVRHLAPALTLCAQLHCSL
jgi:hypothetical protein